MAGLGEFDNRIKKKEKKSFRKILQGSVVEVKAALSLPERRGGPQSELITNTRVHSVPCTLISPAAQYGRGRRGTC